MRLQYDNSAVERYFFDYRLMQKKIGHDMTKAVKKHVNQLQASKNFGIFLSLGLGKPHSLSGDLAGYFSVHITANYRLILKPIICDAGAEAISDASVVLVKGVDEYHGGKNEWLIP